MIPSYIIKRQQPISHQNGFTLVELIVTIVLVGIIGTFTTLFVYTGLNGYLRAKNTVEGALSAQIALDRIALELRHINDIQIFAPNVSTVYTSDTLPGVRRIQYNSPPGNISIRNNTGQPDRLLLDHVTSFAMNGTKKNLDNSGDGSLEYAYIDVAFTVRDMGRQFNLRIYPRNMVK